MIKRTLLAILFLFLAAGVQAQNLAKAPDFRFVCFEDCPTNLSDLSRDGKPVVVKFWSLGCRICLQEIPGFLEAANNRGLDIYFVNVGNDVGPIKTYLNKRRIKWPVLFDRNKRIARKYGVTRLPKTVYIDRRGNIVATVVGADKELKIFDKYATKILED